MKEIMAIESIVEEYFNLQGYLTQTRVNIKKSKSYGYSNEFDVLAFHPGNKEFKIIEVKATGKYNNYSLTGSTKKKLFNEIDIKDKIKRLLDEYNDKYNLRDYSKYYVIVAPIEPEKDFNNEKQKLPKKLDHIKIEILPIHQLFLSYIKEVYNQFKDRRIPHKRYAHPVSEFWKQTFRFAQNQNIKDNPDFSWLNQLLKVLEKQN